MKRLKSFLKMLVALIAVANIALMLLFEYKLPLLVNAAGAGQNDEAETPLALQNEAAQVGTIEAVEKEKSSLESEAAEMALAKAKEEETAVEEEAEKDPDAPLLELTDDHIYLQLGERFNYMSYIKTMEDVDGSDLSRYIHLDREVDTWTPGEIELTYRITSTITGKSSSKVLLITIQE